jgi:hypothetical protein
MLIFVASLIIVVVLIFPPSTIDHFPPVGTWGSKTVGQEVTVEFGHMSSQQKPTDLNLVLIMNDTTAGRYAFTSNNDGELIFFNGEEVGTLTYSDLADNERIDAGDEIALTDLAPGSDFELLMIWAPTGDRMASTTFTTPP